MSEQWEQFERPEQRSGQVPLCFGPRCGATYVFAQAWARAANDISWSPLVCTLPAGHGGAEHCDELLGCPWEAR